jgi:hypothetical protein
MMLQRTFSYDFLHTIILIFILMMMKEPFIYIYCLLLKNTSVIETPCRDSPFNKVTLKFADFIPDLEIE